MTREGYEAAIRSSIVELAKITRAEWEDETYDRFGEDAINPGLDFHRRMEAKRMLESKMTKTMLELMKALDDAMNRKEGV